MSPYPGRYRSRFCTQSIQQVIIVRVNPLPRPSPRGKREILCDISQNAFRIKQNLLRRTNYHERMEALRLSLDVPDHARLF
jgi:hypothetical protein